MHSPSIFVEAIELGIALLEGGNPIIQKSVFNKLMSDDLSQSFFKARFSMLYCSSSYMLQLLYAYVILIIKKYNL